MSRFAFALGLLAWGVTEAGSAEPKKQVPAKALSPVAMLQIVRSGYPEVPADPQTKLDSMLNALTEAFRTDHNVDLKFEINYAAFAAEGVNAPNEAAIVQERGLPRMMNVSLARYLRAIMERVPCPSGADFLPHQDRIEITTRKTIRAQIWGEQYKGPFLPLVHARFDKKPLDAALKVLALQCSHNILVDGKVSEKAKTPVTAELLNLPLDTAVALLADMAELRPVLRDNAIYVTARENVARWEPAGKKGKKDDKDRPRVGHGIRGLLPLTNEAAKAMGE